MTPDDETKLRRAWEIYDHAENVLAQRMNWNMVAQSMLLVAFVTVFVGQLNSNKAQATTMLILEIAVIWTGVMMCVFQYNRVRTVSERIQHLQKQYLIPLDPVFKDYMGVIPVAVFARRVRQHQTSIYIATTWAACALVALAGYAQRLVCAN